MLCIPRDIQYLACQVRKCPNGAFACLQVLPLRFANVQLDNNPAFESARSGDSSRRRQSLAKLVAQKVRASGILILAFDNLHFAVVLE